MNNNKNLMAKILLDDNVGVVIDLSDNSVEGTVRPLRRRTDSLSSYGSEEDYHNLNRALYENTIDLLCEKLSLKRNKPEEKLGPYHKIKENDIIVKKGEICPICREKYCQGLYKRELSCHHIFHKKCIDRWLRKNTSCPVCKKYAF